MFNTAYQKKLQSPLWQRKRLEILQRDNFTCQHCGDNHIQLHVHHQFYEKGVEPWDHPEYLLITLCKVCHLVVENINRHWGGGQKIFVNFIKKYVSKEGDTVVCVSFIDYEFTIDKLVFFKYENDQVIYQYRMDRLFFNEIQKNLNVE